MSNVILCDRAEDVLPAFQQLRAMDAVEDAREMQYEGDLLKAELCRVIEALYEGRIDFETAVSACRLIEKTADNLILSQEEAEELWQLWQGRIVTWKEMLMLCDLIQNDRIRVKAEMSEKLAMKAPNRGEYA